METGKLITLRNDVNREIVEVVEVEKNEVPKKPIEKQTQL